MDYRFAIQCWQDQAGDENAKANVFVNGTQVLTEVEVTATSADSPSIIVWENTGLADDLASVDIKVVLTNEYYVDSDTDRNIIINGLGFLTKSSEYTNYRKTPDVVDGVVPPQVTVTDFNDFNNYYNSNIPTAVTGDGIASDWWGSRESNGFYNITVQGSEDVVTGVTMTLPLGPGNGAL